MTRPAPSIRSSRQSDPPTESGRALGVVAFVGVFGAGVHGEDLPPAIAGRETRTRRIGPTVIATTGHHGPDEAAETHDGPQLFFTGRPLRGDRLLRDGALGTLPDAAELDGKFGGARIELAGIELFTDCLGAGAVFYAIESGQLFFASHLGPLLSILPRVPELTDLGLAQQLFARTQILDETHFSGVLRLGAGKRLVARLDSTGESTKIDLADSDGPAALLDLPAARFTAESIRERLETGVRREAFDERSVLMLSGGRDSLAIALAAGAPRRAVNYGESYSVDCSGGRRRARQLGLRFERVPYAAWTLDAYRDRIVDLHAGSSGLQTTHNLVAFDWARERADLAAVGFLGDALTGAHLGPEAAPDEATVLKYLLPNHRNPLLKKLFPAERQAMVELVMDTFIARSRETDPRRALMLLDLEWRQARRISLMFDLCDWFLPTAYPFFQRGLIASSLQAEGAALKGQHAYDRALAAGLAERGVALSFGGPISPELEAKLRAWSRFRRPVRRCDWPAVVARSGMEPSFYRCGHERLDELTRRSWDADSARSSTKYPLALTSAPIGAAVIRRAANAQRPRDRFGRPLPGGRRDGPAAGRREGSPRSVGEACRAGIALFDAGSFFEAHECFESCWKAADVAEQDRDFWKGVTQIAVGCCHVQRGNDRGALALLERASSYLADYPSPHLGLETTALISLAGSVAERVRRHGATARLDFPVFPRSNPPAGSGAT